MRTALATMMILALVGCNNDPQPNSVTVNVTNSYDGSSIQGTTVKISYITASGAQETVSTGQTDSNGEWSFSTTNQQELIARASYATDAYFGSSTFGAKDVDYFKAAQTSNVNLSLMPAGHLELLSNNTNCTGTDTLAVYLDYENQNWVYPFGGVYPIEITGCGTNDLLAGFYKLPIGTYTLTWDVTRNGSTNSFSDSFVLTHEEQKSYTINY